MSTSAETIETFTIETGRFEIYVERRGTGPDLLLLGGLSDPIESWEPQLTGLADRYRITAFDNPGAGRTPLPDGDLTIEDIADGAAAVLHHLGIESAHVAGFSGGSRTAQELALRHPSVVRSLVLQSTWASSDAYFRAMADSLRWLVETAPSEKAMLEAFFLWVYTARAHDDGTVAQIIEETLVYPHPQSAEAFQRQLAAWVAHDTYDRLPSIAAPTLVIAGGADIMTPPRHGREAADRIPGARFLVLDDEAHQPFQEIPDEWNAIVDAFWREVDGR